MDREFGFSDLSRVHWGSTVKLTLARGFFAGLVWTPIIGAAEGAAMSIAWRFVYDLHRRPDCVSDQQILAGSSEHRGPEYFQLPTHDLRHPT